MVIHLCSAVSTEHKPRQRIRFSQRVDALGRLAELLCKLPCFPVHNGLVGILKDPCDGAPEDKTLEEALAEERTLELESELEQDEHPRDYTAELEDEEEEAAPTSEKRLKREIRAEALRRLEEAARTESDFLTVVDEWNKLDRNRERRERDHENLRGDVPLEFQAVPEPRIVPL